MERDQSKNTYPMNAIRICIDECRRYDAAGRMYSKLVSGAVPFSGMADLLIRTDRVLDNGGPQSFQKKRSFQPESPPGRGRTVWRPPRIRLRLMEDEEIYRRQGRYATYDVIIQSRMHASWQGLIRDEKGQLLGSFESELQLMKIILTHLIRKKGMPETETGLAEDLEHKVTDGVHTMTKQCYPSEVMMEEKRRKA